MRIDHLLVVPVGVSLYIEEYTYADAGGDIIHAYVRLLQT